MYEALKLANGVMHVLSEHTKRDDTEADDQHDKSDMEDLPISSPDFGRIRNVGDGCHLIQMAKIVQQILHTCVALAWVTTDCTHNHCGESR